MTQLLLHIGPGKTGTTSIQESLLNAARQGLLGEICYPEVGQPGHNFIAALYRPIKHLPRGYRRRYMELGTEALERDARKFKEALFRSIRESDKAIVSAEHLSRFTRDEVRRLRLDLQQIGVAKVGVIAYARTPTSLYVSSVQQRLKAASTFGSPEKWRHPILRALNIWSREFPNLTVRPFIRDRMVQGNVVSDFLAVAATFFGLTESLDVPDVATNRSISAEGMIVLQRYRDLFHSNAQDVPKPDSTALVGALQRSLEWTQQSRPQLVASAAKSIVDRHSDDLETLRERYSVDLRADPADPGADSVDEPRYGVERLNDVKLILDAYNDETVHDVALYCVWETLNGRMELSGSQISNLRRQASELEEELERHKREAATARSELQQVKVRLEETLASRSWRWGHRAALVLSSPRRVVRAVRGRR